MNLNEQGVTALRAAAAWLERWAQHVGGCGGGDRCTCGLAAVRYETAIAVQAIWVREVEQDLRDEGSEATD